MILPPQDILVNPYDQFLEVEKEVFNKHERVVPTFSEALNSHFLGGGIEPANVMLIGAKYNVGKTFFILNWIRYLMANRFRCIFFSLDMDFKKMFIRLLRQILETGRLDAEVQWRADKDRVRDLLTKAGYFDYLRIYTNEKKALSFDEISFICDREKPDIVFIDHFSKVYGGGHNVYQETRQIAEYFRRKKKEMNTIFAILMQLKKGEKQRDQNKIPPGKDEYKGAGEIGEDADIMLSLCRPDIDQGCEEGYKKTIIGALRKNRLNDEPNLDYIRWSYDSRTTIMKDTLFQ
jgi:replicative DNA helicase